MCDYYNAFHIFYQLLFHTCEHVMLLYVCCIHVLWAGGLNRNKPFVLVLEMKLNTNSCLSKKLV